MKIFFDSDLKEQNLEAGTQFFSKQLGFELSRSGIPIRIEQRNGNIEVGLNSGQGWIRYQDKVHFFRALGLFLEALAEQNDFRIVEVPQFTRNGAMFDVSRNAVLTVDSIKRFIPMMALMGLNMMMMYTEDTYTIESQPYFGYMRGRYRVEELRECDDFAEMFGIEMIPCIQTLGHLKEALKWHYAKEMKDTDDILLVGEEKTYTFIEEMIVSASAPFRSQRIHIGMDEAHDLGLGNYLTRNGYHTKFDIMNEHLNRVNDIAIRHGLDPMIWSDMYFRIGSRTGDYRDLDAVIPDEIVRNIPSNIQLVYWDYYTTDEDFYVKFIQKHKGLGSDPVFAGGIWTWTRMSTNYRKTLKATAAALQACKKERIKEIFVTLWNDNGAETNYFSAILGLQLYAEHGYSETPDLEKLKRRFRFCTGGNYDAFMDLSHLDDTPGTNSDQHRGAGNPSKFLLWQDVMLGLFDKNIEGLHLSEHFSHLEKRLADHAAASGEWNFVFEMPRDLCAVLVLKSEIGVHLKKYYDHNQTDELERIAFELLPLLKQKVEKLRTAHRDQWFQTNKPFGWEVLDIRYGGLLARMDTAIVRIGDYLSGKIDRIDELEEERLYYNRPNWPEGSELHMNPTYSKTISASSIG